MPALSSAESTPHGSPSSISNGPNPQSPLETIIDYLSADPQYSYFLRHIQRLGLVPAINQMANVTVFAPVNSAFVDSQLAFNDSKANLLRYFANQRFRVSYLNSTTVVLDSLYETKKSDHGSRVYPLKISPNHSNSGLAGPYTVNDVAEILEYDGYAKHQRSFIQTIDHLLPQAVSMCDLLMDSAPGSYDVNGHSIHFVKSVFQSVFAKKTALKNMPWVSCEEYLANVSTVLIPTDKLVNTSLSDLEKRYFLTLHHGLKNPDLYPTKEAVRELRADYFALLSNLFLPHLVGGSNGTSEGQRHSSISGKNNYTFSFDSNSNRIRLNEKISSVAGSTSLTLSDGLLHIFDLDIRDDSQAADFVAACNIERVKMIPRKALYAMHFSQLARELRFYKKSDLIGESATNQTILVDASDRDDFFDEDEVRGNQRSIESEGFNLLESDEVYDSDDETSEVPSSELMSTTSFSTRQQISYKFMDGFIDMAKLITPERPRFHELLDSKLCSKKRINSCFKVKISGVFQNGKPRILFNDKFEAGPPLIAAGNNSIYVSETDFTVPASFKSVIAQLISDGTMREYLDHVKIDKSLCLQTLKYLERFDLLSLKDNYKGYTAFLPCGRPLWDGTQRQRNKNYASWNSLGLILRYLESHPKIFKKVLQDNFLEDLIYSDFGLEDNVETFRLVKTLNGDNVNVSETYQEGDYNHVISLNDTSMSIPLNSDVLFNQGVIHITQKVLLPNDFRVSLRDLIISDSGASPDQSSFVSFIEKFPKFSSMIGLDSPQGSDYSLLLPTSESLRAFNITTDFNRLLEFLELHIITNAEAESMLKCMGIPYFEPSNSTHRIQTNRTRGVFMCHTNPSSGKTFLSLPKKLDMFQTSEVAVEHQVRVVNYGCSQQENASSSCVFLLERPLDVAWLDAPDNFLHVHIGWISVGIGIVIGVILFGFCTTTVALCLSRAGRKKDQNSALESNFKPAGPSYMPITSDEDLLPENTENGYETDVDMMRTETDQLLSGDRNGPALNYGSSSPVGAPSAPRKIKKQGLLDSINRDRNLPPVNVG